MEIPLRENEITLNWMQTILDKSGGNICVANVKTELGTKDGENYSSEMIRATVTGTNNGNPWQGSYIIKLMPSQEWMRKVILDLQLFKQEVEAYEKILPAMLQSQQAQTKMKTNNCRCVFADINTNGDGVIVLEDLKPLGYTLKDVTRSLDVDHCKLVMDSLAKFHALGYKYKFSLDQPLPEKHEIFEDFFYEKSKETDYKKHKIPCQVACQILQNKPGKENILEILECNKEIMKEKAYRNDPKEPLSTICHGDIYTNNMMFSYGEDEKPLSVVLFDLQLMHYSPPTKDLGYFFCISTDGVLRRNHLKGLLQHYHQKLLKYSADLGVSQITDATFPFELLWNMYYKETIYFGLMQALEALPFLFIENKEILNPKNETGEDLVETRKRYREKLMETAIKSDKACERICHLVEEMINEGTF